MQDPIVGLILILIGLKKILSHVNLSYIRKYFKVTTNHKIQRHLKCLKSQSEIENVWGKLSFTVRSNAQALSKVIEKSLFQ